MKSYQKILKSIWCSDLQIEIFINLWRWWAKPASTIAKLIGAERTHVYKMLQQMVQWWILAQSEQKGTTTFWIPSANIFDTYYDNQQSLIDQSRSQLSSAYAELEELWSNASTNKPIYRMREWHDALRDMFANMIQHISTSNFKMIKIFGLNTLENAATTTYKLADYAWWLFDYCKTNNIYIQTTLGSGIAIPEDIIYISDISWLMELSAWQSSLYIFVIWDLTYFAVFKDIPIGFKRELVELADLFHFVDKIIKK